MVVFGLKFAIGYIVITTLIITSSFHLYSKSLSFNVSFLLWVKMDSINWSGPNKWVFIAQLMEHCSTNTEAMGSNPVEAQTFFLPKIYNNCKF